jgi:hypothetical protein
MKTDLQTALWKYQQEERSDEVIPHNHLASPAEPVSLFWV